MEEKENSLLNLPQKFKAEFLEEGKDRLCALGDGLQKLQKNHDDIDLIRDMMREIHTYKSMSAMLGYENSAQLSYGMESTLGAIRDKEVDVCDCIDTLFESYDILQKVYGEVEKGDEKTNTLVLANKLKSVSTKKNGGLRTSDGYGAKTLDQINREAGSRASDALSKLINRHVDVLIPKAKIKVVKEFNAIVGADEDVTGIYLPLSGDITGATLLILPKETAFNLADLMVGRGIGTTIELSLLDESALKEMANILTGNYFTVFSDSLDIRIVEHVPQLSVDSFGTIMAEVVTDSGSGIKNALVVELEFVFEPVKLIGHLFMFFWAEGIDTILKKLE